MKRNVTGIILLLCLLLAAAAGAETYTENNGNIPDREMYSGSMESAYTAILRNHSAAIHGYQNRRIEFTLNGRDYSVPCLPAATADLDQDGSPELLFLEEAAGGTRGDLWAYSCNGSWTRCVLYLPGITRLDYDPLLDFHIYLHRDGSLVVEHYQYEKPWALRFSVRGKVTYELAESLTVQGDYSGEGNDVYYRNGQAVSAAEYDAALQNMRDGRTRTISAYMKPDYSSYGLDVTWEQAVSLLDVTDSGRNIPASRTDAPVIRPADRTTTRPTPARFEGVYGLTIDRIATRTGPGTQYDGGGTYDVKGQYIKVLAKAWDTRNEIWWVKCVIPYHGEERVLWTGYKRFDHSTLFLEDLPEEDNW